MLCIICRTFFFLHTDDIKPWMIWGYYVSPMMYGQNAIAINEFLDDRWSTVSYHNPSKDYTYFH